MDTELMIVEQTEKYPKRMKYNPVTNSFYETQYDALGSVRGVKNSVYGWLKRSGTPPNSHMDIILCSTAEYDLGEEVPVWIVGCFLRNDGDHKLVGVPVGRPERDLYELPEEERENLFRLYPRVDPGEGWFGADRAKRLIADYFARISEPMN